MGWEQTEINALSTLQPDVLRQIVQETIAPFFDHTMGPRIRKAKAEWEWRAYKQIQEQLDAEKLSSLQADADARVLEMSTELDEIKAEIESAMGDIRVDVPKPEIPEVDIDDALQGKPLVASAWSWPDQTKALKAHKSYTNCAAG